MLAPVILRSPFASTLHLLPAVLLVAGVAAACLGSPESDETPWPTDGWITATPEAEGLDGAPFVELDAEIRQGTYGNINRMVVVRNGRLVVNERYERDYSEISRGHSGILGCGVDMCTDSLELHDYNYYHPDWHPYHQGRDVHTLQSVTKSVGAVLMGVAIHQGHLPGVGVSLLPFFQDFDLSRVDERLHRATLDDLLTMRTGIEWHEDRPIDETNTTIQLEKSDDWIQFTLDQPMDSEPGETWTYNSGGSHMMSEIIRQATGHYVDAYAEDHLFGPLGIRDHHWKRTPTGLPDMEGGLFLEAEDLARIGYLHLRGGVWEGRRILPEGWVEASTSRRVEGVNPQGWGYGYQWWRPDPEGVEVWAGLGFGGQFLLIVPEHDLIGVVNGWNVFGERHPPMVSAMLDALLASVGHFTDSG